MTEFSKRIMRESITTRIHYPSFNSYHEGYAVILEELDEVWTEIKKKEQSEERIREEMIQVGAMVLRFLYDLQNCPDVYPKEKTTK